MAGGATPSGEPAEPARGTAGEPGAAPPALVDGRVELAVCAGVAALGIALIVVAGDVRPGTIPDPIGSAGLPRIVGAILTLLGTALVVRRLLTWRHGTTRLVPAEGGTVDEPGYPASAVRAFGLLLAGLAWALLLPRLGYMVSTVGLCAVTMAAMGVRPWRIAVISVVFTFAMWLLFSQVFGVRFPTGPLDELAQRLVPRLGF